jgi:hypothetical protein
MADIQRLSAHFTLAEMIESGTARRDPELWRRQCAPAAGVEGALQQLATTTLEPLRHLFDWPIRVNSGYRCVELNRRVGGAKRSQHCLGEAADIRLGPGWTPERASCRLPLDLVSDSLDGRVDLLIATGWLFAVAAVLVEELDIDQVIHEYGGGFGRPAWVHVSHGSRRRRSILAIGEWTGGAYRSYDSLADMALEAGR